MGNFRWFMGAPPKKDRKVILYRFVDDLRFYLFEGFCWGKNNTKCRIGSRRNLLSQPGKFVGSFGFPMVSSSQASGFFPVT